MAGSEMMEKKNSRYSRVMKMRNKEYVASVYFVQLHILGHIYVLRFVVRPIWTMEWLCKLY